MQVDEQMQNSEIFLTHAIEIPAPAASDDIEPHNKVHNENGQVASITSISYLPTHSLLTMTLKTGQTLIGRLDLRSLALSNCTVIRDLRSMQVPNAQQLAMNGSSFSNFTELPFMTRTVAKNGKSNQSIFLMATFSKQGGSVACILELAASKIKINLVKGKAASLQSKMAPLHGYALVNPSFTKAWRKAPRLLTIDEAGHALVFKVEQQDASSEERKDASFLKEMSAFRKIAKADLPKKVIMPANFFEK